MTKLYTAKEWAGIPEIGEAAAPVDTVKEPLLEKDIQKQCVDWARARGYWARKVSSMSQRSIPDYQFAKILDTKRIKFTTEFKRLGKTSTPAQLDEQKAMVEAGWLFFECDNFEKFKYEVERIELACCTMEAWCEPK